MERRRALVVAGTLTATLAMAGTAMAVNLGLLGDDGDAVGDLTPTAVQAPTTTTAEPRVRVVVQDIPVPGGGSGAQPGAAVGAGPAAATASPGSSPAVVEDHGGDDGGHSGGDDDVFDDDRGEDHQEDEHDDEDEHEDHEEHEDDD